MHIHILGICGTFMGGIALLARASGHRVTGCDANVYPPMSTQLEAQGIELIEGYEAGQIALAPDLFVVGNAISRGNPLLEALLDKGLPYISGPQWLAQNILRDKWVLAVAGTPLLVIGVQRYRDSKYHALLRQLRPLVGAGPHGATAGLRMRF